MDELFEADTAFTVDADGSRELSRHQARHPRFLLTSRGVRADAAIVREQGWSYLEHPVTRWHAAQLPLADDAVLSHATAALILGLPLPVWLADQQVIHVTAPRSTNRPRRRDICTHHASLVAVECAEVNGFRVTSPARTYTDVAYRLKIPELVAFGDAIMRKYGTSQRELLATILRRKRYPGRRKARYCVDYLDPRAESPKESELRMLLRETRLPTPSINPDILDHHGQFLARGDIAFEEYRVLVEYDGAYHAQMHQRAHDAARRAALRQHGWIVVEVVGEDMRHPGRIVSRVQAALVERGWHP
ncbi:MAG TPA: DUF559 domain-containing protein [Candidatus Nanopelagicales bacterium]|nr:DUF559 domain-containing protein [Candidatus Nanopelagicales bacterium]